MIRTFDSGRRTRSAMTRWSQFGCWIALQTTIPSPFGAAMNACGSIANWVTIGKAYAPSTTTSASRSAASRSPHA